MTKLIVPSLTILLTFSYILASCGEDRSGEHPFAPTVQTGTAVQEGDSVLLTGSISASPNSTLKQCGFDYGNDTLRLRTTATEVSTTFHAYTDSLGKGEYYAIAFATNGVGTSHGDTIRFVVE